MAFSSAQRRPHRNSLDSAEPNARGPCQKPLGSAAQTPMKFDIAFSSSQSRPRRNSLDSPEPNPRGGHVGKSLGSERETQRMLTLLSLQPKAGHTAIPCIRQEPLPRGHIKTPWVLQRKTQGIATWLPLQPKTCHTTIHWIRRSHTKGSNVNKKRWFCRANPKEF